MKFGLNLYSIRNLVGTPEGFRETAHKLKEMGYDTLQISGVPCRSRVFPTTLR